MGYSLIRPESPTQRWQTQHLNHAISIREKRFFRERDRTLLEKGSEQTKPEDHDLPSLDLGAKPSLIHLFAYLFLVLLF